VEERRTGLVPSWFYVIYIRTYVHMCILLSERNTDGGIRDCADLVGAQSFRESVTYIKYYVYPFIYMYVYVNGYI